MSNVVIYYAMSQKENENEVILEIERLLSRIEENVLGVYIDKFNSSREFLNLISNDFTKLDKIYLNKPLENEFDQQLILELSKSAIFIIDDFQF